MEELRCKKCNKLLGKYNGEIEVKCPRCGILNYNKCRNGFIPRNFVKECLDRVENKSCLYFARPECIYNCKICKHNK